MKRILSFISICAIITVMAGCNDVDDFLDPKLTNELNEATTFADSARTMDFLVGVYTDIGFSFNPNRFGSNMGLSVASDEAEGFPIGGNQPNIIFATGTVTALNIPTEPWRWSYFNIRRANLLLKNLPITPLSANLKKRVEGEARFLRAWYYAILLKHYGGVPLVGDRLYEATDIISGQRNTFEECVEYILSECDAAASMLPPQHLGQDYGRITSGACLALKSRVMLYAASPLFNGGGIATDPQLKAITGYPEYSEQRWLRAAEAAEAVMQLQRYALHENNETAPGYGFQEVFTLRQNPEYILAHMKARNKELENMWDPPTRGGANGAVFPYQELVDAFGMQNGKSISDPESAYDPANPYANRDPRFGYTILHNEALRLDRNNARTPVLTYVGAGQDAMGSATKTGYYVRKMLDENVIQALGATSERTLPLIRYAEILLNRAEALNEYLGGPDDEVYQLLKDIRKRAGIIPDSDGMYGLKTGMNQVEMREVIRNERRVELAFEEHRYWDVRRWKIAEETDDRMLHGMSIGRTSPGVYTYTQVPVRQHVFRPNMYLWPIPQSEVSKSMDLDQNPGW